jgi:hypothetical protein
MEQGIIKMNDNSGRMWDRQVSEPARWFYRLDTFYRPLGPERNLLASYRMWHQAEKGRKSTAASAPTSWREAAERWQWAERAEAWDVVQRLERLKEEDAARRKNRERRIALLNAVMARASDALLRLQADEAKWGDVMAAIRLAVQELRHEYGDDVTTVKVEAAEAAPDWMLVMSRMDEQQLDKVISNLEMVGSHE